jgi:hypothetical protein
MTGELTDLDRTVIEALSVSRLVIAVCAVLAHTRGTARLRDLINLVEAVSAVSGKRAVH